MAEAKTKTCTKCGLDRPLTVFPTRKDRGNRLRSHCKPCHNVWQTTNRGKQLTRDSTFQRKYGISGADYDRMLREQSGACALCGRSDERLHVDHSHSTGAVRGLLCANCNMALGLLRDDPEVLIRAAKYVLGIWPN